MNIHSIDIFNQASEHELLQSPDYNLGNSDKAQSGLTALTVGGVNKTVGEV